MAIRSASFRKNRSWLVIPGNIISSVFKAPIFRASEVVPKASKRNFNPIRADSFKQPVHGRSVLSINLGGMIADSGGGRKGLRGEREKHYRLKANSDSSGKANSFRSTGGFAAAADSAVLARTL